MVALKLWGRQLPQRIALSGNGSCHFVWTLGDCCLFPGSPGAEGMLLSLILYFGIHVWKYPLGFLHSFFPECSFDPISQRFLSLRTLEVIH